jgi:histidinol-phosphate aminotransferase
MALSRRDFVRTIGAGAAGAWVAARGGEAVGRAFGGFDHVAGRLAPLADGSSAIILNSNENPVGPFAPIVEAVHGAFGAANRYPFASVTDVTAAIAKANGVKPENVLLGTGSTQVLRTAIQLFTSKDRPLVQPLSTFETPGQYAATIATPVTTVPLTSSMHFDLDGLVAASRNAGAIYYCNPNNPVANAIDGRTTRDFIAAVRNASPETTIVIDEAYFHYATTGAVESMIPVAVENPRVIVARTFSKAFGMAGLRLGYAVSHKDTIAKMAAWDGPGTVSVLALEAGRAAMTMDTRIVSDERQRNADVRAFTTKWFADRGYPATDSQANFIFVDVKRPTAAFRAACQKEEVLVGRDFPPYATHCRITVGAMAEMQQAVKVFEKVLAAGAVEA